MGRVTLTRVAIVLVSAPVVAMACAWLAVLALAGTGPHPIWSLDAQNLAEAAAFRDGGALVRFVEAGEDPRQPGVVRPGVIADEAMTLTPIDAAAIAKRPEIVQLLFDLGLSLDAASWTQAWCLATDRGVRAVLQAHRPDGAVDGCENAEGLSAALE